MFICYTFWPPQINKLHCRLYEVFLTYISVSSSEYSQQSVESAYLLNTSALTAPLLGRTLFILVGGRSSVSFSLDIELVESLDVTGRGFVDSSCNM